MRQLYCVLAEKDGKALVVGPFKTKAQARKAGEKDWSADPEVSWRVMPLIYFSDEKERMVTLTYDRLYDPAVRSKCAACKQKIDGGEVDSGDKHVAWSCRNCGSYDFERRYTP